MRSVLPTSWGCYGSNKHNKHMSLLPEKSESFVVLITIAINLEYSLEGLMLKLKLQCFGHLMQRADSLEKTLMLGKTEGRRRRG